MHCADDVPKKMKAVVQLEFSRLEEFLGNVDKARYAAPRTSVENTIASSESRCIVMSFRLLLLRVLILIESV